MAVLAVIGGVDSRPRLGGLVQHKEWGLGTVCRIAPNGKVTVQCEGQQKAKICSISQVKPVRNQKRQDTVLDITNTKPERTSSQLGEKFCRSVRFSDCLL